MDKTKIIKKIQDYIKKEEQIFSFSHGWALDGFLGEVTRKHDDVDIDVFGYLSRKEGLEKIKNIFAEFNPEFNEIYYTFNIDDTLVEIGYIQIKKEDYENDIFVYDAGESEFTLSKLLYLKDKGNINGLFFTITNPIYLLAEKIFLPIAKSVEYREKDFRDINSMLRVLDKKDIQRAVFERYKYTKRAGYKDVGMP